MGGGRRGKKSKKTRTKAQKMAIANKAKYGGTAKAAAANKASMRAKAKSYTKSYGAASVAAANKASMQAKAKAKYTASQANKALAKAGGTSAQVSKDNKRYGNTFPSGAISISEKGKAEAAANLAARTAPEGGFNISTAGKKQAAAQLQEKRTADKAFKNLQARDPGMAKYIASLPANVRNDALIGGQTRAAGVELGIGLGTLAAGKAALGSLGIGAASKGLGYKGVQAGFTGMGKTGFDAIRGGAKYIASNKPQILGKGAYSAPTFKGAMRYAGKGTSLGPLGGTQTPGGVIKSIVPGKASRIGFIESQAKVPGATFDKGVQLANRLQSGAFPNSPLANTLRAQFNTGIAPGGGFGTNLGPVSAGAAITAGGLNIAAAGDNSGQSNTGRTVVTTDRDKNINYDIGGIAKDVGLGLADWATGNKFDFDNLGRPGDDKTFTQRFETFKKSPLQQAIISKQTGIDAKRIINEGEDAAKSLFSNYIGDIDASSKKGVRQPIAKFLKDVGSDDATAMAGRAIDAYGYNDPNFSDDPNKLTKFLSSVSAIPNLSQENVQDLRHTFNKTVTEPTDIQGKSILKNVPYNQALGFANRIVSGKLSDATGEAMNQLGMGNVAGIDDAVKLGMQINTNRQTKDTLANKRFGELDTLIQKYGPGKGQIPTIPSIIKGIGGARRTGGSGNNLTISGSNNMTATIPDAITPEILPLPTTVAQGGTNATDLASTQQQAYNNQMSIYGMNPNYFANIMQPRLNTRPRRFRQVFNRGYF